MPRDGSKKGKVKTAAGKSTPLRDCVEKELNKYFKLLDGQKPCELHKMVVGETEQVLLEVVLRTTEGNQTRAAEYLGMSRGTLRKKMKLYELE